VSIERHEFAGRLALAPELAKAVAANITAAIAARGAASLAVSGGSTPARFFAALGKHTDIDWDKVTVTLVDERWVPDTHDRSNAMLVNETLLQGPAAVAHFVPLYTGGAAPDAAAVARANAGLAEVPRPFAAVILGMGEDGHTASFFPGSDRLDQALTAPGPAIAITAPGAGEPRITLTLPTLLNTDALYLHIEQKSKAEVLDRALAEGEIADMPVRAVLRQTVRPVHIYWCP
jgi:6-phosphogluconolactonase